jgi:hypothetical protein
MLDHLFLRFLSTLRSSLADSMLERAELEEQLHHDLLLGDVTFETSYSLPGESDPPRVRVDLTAEWPAWSQSAYRSWSVGEGMDESLEIVLEVAVRFMGLAGDPTAITDELSARLPKRSQPILSAPMELARITIEKVSEFATGEQETNAEAVYETTLTLDEAILEDVSQLDTAVGRLTGWIASVLVLASDIPLSYQQL